LTLAESATLAGMIQRPSYYSPIRHPDRARTRRDFVLQLMARNGHISAEELQAALNTPLETVSAEIDYAQAPYFLDLMKQELRAKFPAGLEGKHRVNTTIDMALQRDAVDAVRVGMQEVDRRMSRRQLKDGTDGLQAALVALDPHTGEIKALVGGRDYNSSQLNRAKVRRQPGSIFKPFVFAAALQTALRHADAAVTSATILEDAPTSFFFNRQNYAPNNFGDEYYGRVTLRTALVRSINVATVNLAQMIGYPAVARVAKAAGLTNAAPTPSIALGAYDATALEMAGAWTVFANGGTYVEPHFISSVQDHTGAPIYTSTPKRIPVLDPRVAYLMVNLLQEVLQSGTGAGVRSRGFVAPAAGKTGTSRDGWFAGFTSDLLAIVWVGFDDHRDLQLQGARSALPIWTEFMKRAVKHGVAAKPFRVPPGIARAEVDVESGQLAGPYCEAVRTEYFIAGTEPHSTCTLHELPPFPSFIDFTTISQ
jgi:penicillin-binding protein 1B